MEKLDGVGNKIERFTKDYTRIVMSAFLVLVLAVSPFYAPNGYVDIGMHKFYFFRITAIFCFCMLLPAVVFFLVKSYQREERLRLSVTDWAALAYAGAVLLSFMFSGWKEVAFWGAEGWYMGMFSQLMFVVIYFAVSRLVKGMKKWYALLLVVSAAVFLLGVLNRFSVYPLQLNGANPGFISTLGNINWFCSYWMVLFPIGLVMYWNGTGTGIVKRIGLTLYVLLGFMTGIVQGSSSGFLSLGAVVFVLLILSFNDGRRLLKWLELLLLFSVSMLVLSIVQSGFPEALNYQNIVSEWLTKYSVGCLFLSLSVTGYAVAHYFIRYKKCNVKKIIPLRNAVIAVVVVLLLAVGIAFLFYNCFPGKAQGSVGEKFIIDAQWGNGRGTTWYAGGEAFSVMTPMEKLVGVGPDCFYKYVYSNWDIATELYRIFGDARLTNAHNEWLTVLVNVGVCGLISYVSFLGTAAWRQFKEGKNRELLLLSAVCIVSYTVHNMVSFQQIICTPLIFVLAGFGENLMRKGKSGTEKSTREKNEGDIL